MNDKEVFIAKNGRPYVKDENGRVKFISNTDWEQYMQKNQTKEDRRTLMVTGLFVSVLVGIYIANNMGWL